MNVVDDKTLTVTAGALGSAGETSYEDLSEVYEPVNFLLAEMVAQLPEGYVEILPDDLLARVEKAHNVVLQGRIKEFYLRQEYKSYQGKICKKLGCKVDFIASAVQYSFDQEYYDSKMKKPIQLVPISSKWVQPEYTYEDEQQWIGFDPMLPDGPIFGLYTSGEYDQAFKNLDEFLASLT